MQLGGLLTSTAREEPVGNAVRLPDFGLVESASQADGDFAGLAMSVDVEEHFQVSAFARNVDRMGWSGMPSRVSRNTGRILDLFDQFDCKATFFALGWVAEREPGLMRTIVGAGHELASHGYSHERVSAQAPADFRQDVVRAKALLEDIAGVAVRGYRAPSFSIGPSTPWAHDILGEAGYTYSSSVYPIRHDHYGVPDAPRFPYRPRGQGIVEIPLSTARIAGLNLPAAGGGYFRLLPLSYSKWALRQVSRNNEMRGVFYFHPWELDPDQPRVHGIPLVARFRHYVNLGRFQQRLEDVLSNFRWNRVDRVFAGAIKAS